LSIAPIISSTRKCIIIMTMGPVSWCLGCTAAFWLNVQPQTLLSAKVQQPCASYKEAEVPYWGFAYILWCECEPPKGTRKCNFSLWYRS